MFCNQLLPGTGNNELLHLPLWWGTTLNSLLEFVRAVVIGAQLAGGSKAASCLAVGAGWLGG